ncbi:MAG: hypothetical protein DRO18_04280, partial [Thermoprotei archaeon]
LAKRIRDGELSFTIELPELEMESLEMSVRSLKGLIDALFAAVQGELISLDQAKEILNKAFARIGFELENVREGEEAEEEEGFASLLQSYLDLARRS